jgi:Protein of unknown function (DUF3892)
MPTPSITEVRWTTKSDKTAPYERILEIGTPTMDGACYRISHGQAVRDQLSGVKQFGVSVNGVMIGLKVATTPDGHRYLKSMDDGDQPDSLLNLPDCP